jgi:hypothetical protein
MNDDQPTDDLGLLRTEHRELDQLIKEMLAAGSSDQVELARLKKRKLMLKDQIQMIANRNIPDIIA